MADSERTIRILSFDGKDASYLMWSWKLKAQASIKDHDEVLRGIVKIEEGVSGEEKKLITKMNKRG